jgi:pimeloyl-ACP methyl ester carboxylesterase
MRGVIEPGGQTVDATDRLYLAARVPTLIIWGDQDGMIPVQHGIDAHDEIAGSRLELLEGVGHFPHVEAPDRFCDVLLDFLDSAEPGASPGSLGDVIVAGSSERPTLLDSA